MTGIEQSPRHRAAHAARTNEAERLSSHGSLPVARLEVNALLSLTRHRWSCRTLLAVQIVCQSVKGKIFGRQAFAARTRMTKNISRKSRRAEERGSRGQQDARRFCCRG